ncbi:LysM peptidoglycan-binding domain-containing protein [Roseateles chitinivorans]|uniref:LysM peptidoglycan-binding domain-containing protein n=1 Tax=Roseateles chitinivorans TaxID=2917965 RepID=UPI003D66DE42
MTQTTVYTYLYRDTAQKYQITSTQTGVGTGTTTFSYDVNGYVTTVVDQIAKTTMRYKTNAQGLILSRDTWEIGKEDTTTITHWYFYADGRRVGDVGNDGASERVSYVEQLAQLGLTAKERNERNKNPKPVTTADFDQNYEPINTGYPGSASSSYTVRAGDTLSSIAQSLWGDSAMWYMIADVNGLKGGERLVEGQVLVIPNKLTNIHNNATTYLPYNAGEAIGNVNPTLPEPPPPPAKKGGCGAFGMILMVVVAVVVSYVTAGALTGAMTGLLGQTAGSIAAAAIGAAAGSVASQVVGLATDTIDKFSWKAVGQAAVSGAIAQGIVQGTNLAASGSMGETAKSAADWLSQPNSLSAAVARGALTSSVTQAIQGKWSWKEVGAAAVGSGAGYAAGQALGDAFKGVTGGQILKLATATAVGSWASSQVMGYNSAVTVARMSQAFAAGFGEGINGAIDDARFTAVASPEEKDSVRAMFEADSPANIDGNGVRVGGGRLAPVHGIGGGLVRAGAARHQGPGARAVQLRRDLWADLGRRGRAGAAALSSGDRRAERPGGDLRPSFASKRERQRDAALAQPLSRPAGRHRESDLRIFRREIQRIERSQ